MAIKKAEVKKPVVKTPAAKVEKAPELTPLPSKPTYPPKPSQIITDFNAALDRILKRDLAAHKMLSPGITWEKLFPDMPNAAFVDVDCFDSKTGELLKVQIRFDRGEKQNFVFPPESLHRLRSLHAPILISAGQIVKSAIQAQLKKQA